MSYRRNDHGMEGVFMFVKVKENRRLLQAIE